MEQVDVLYVSRPHPDNYLRHVGSCARLTCPIAKGDVRGNFLYHMNIYTPTELAFFGVLHTAKHPWL